MRDAMRQISHDMGGNPHENHDYHQHGNICTSDNHGDMNMSMDMSIDMNTHDKKPQNTSSDGSVSDWQLASMLNAWSLSVLSENTVREEDPDTDLPDLKSSELQSWLTDFVYFAKCSDKEYGVCRANMVIDEVNRRKTLQKESNGGTDKQPSDWCENGKPTSFIVDSGASEHISGDRRHFKFLTNESAKLKVADRILPIAARIGVFKDNNLNLARGLYHPDIGSNVLISVSQLDHAGYEVQLSGPGRRIVDPQGFRNSVQLRNDMYYVDVKFEDEDISAVCELAEAQDAECQLTKAEKFKMHERCGHFWTSDTRVKNCPACDLAKGGSRGHAKHRPEYLVPTRFLEQVDFDFTGPYPKSQFDKLWLLSAMDAKTGWVENYPVGSKADCANALELFIAQVGLMERVRSDNAPEFKGPNCRWRKVCAKQKPAVVVTFSSPYCPQQNGRIERWNRTQCDAIRSNLYGVDPRVWCYCARFVAYLHNRLKTREGKPSPYCERWGREPSSRHWRKFGCLAYCKADNPGGKLSNRYERGMFLGYARENSSYLIGRWKKDDRCSTRIRFSVEEHRNCKFDESVVIRNLEDLRSFSTGTLVPFRLPDAIEDQVNLNEMFGDPAARSDSRVAPVELSSGDAPQSNGQQLPEFSEDQIPPNPAGDSENLIDVSDPGIVTVESDGLVKKKRGRKKGTKALSHWRKPGPKSGGGNRVRRGVRARKSNSR